MLADYQPQANCPVAGEAPLRHVSPGKASDRLERNCYALFDSEVGGSSDEGGSRFDQISVGRVERRADLSEELFQARRGNDHNHASGFIADVLEGVRHVALPALAGREGADLQPAAVLRLGDYRCRHSGLGPKLNFI